MQRIYLDANATTPISPGVLEAMLPYFTEKSGNPSSAHQSGQRARATVERARSAVATLLHSSPKEIVFTSGGTEGNNLAISGMIQPYLDRREPVHIVTTKIEHHAVLHAVQALEQRGARVTYLDPGSDGVVDPASLQASMSEETKLISVMLANNETGAIQPVGKLARIAKTFNKDIVFHTDAVQAAGKLWLDMNGEFKNVDLLTLSGHKMYGPQGIGVLFVRQGVALTPSQYGGPQERQRRAGTENVPGIVGLGRASELSTEWLASGEDVDKVAALRDRLEQGILTTVHGAYTNGATAERTPNTTNLRFDDVDAEALVIALDMQGIATSFGAACQSGATEPSHVLLAMGLSPKEARGSLRLSLSRSTTLDEIDQALSILRLAVDRLRDLS